jgi:hypothetical protein
MGFGTFPDFAAKNASGPTATDGFPYTADSVNDWIGFTQALLNRAGLTPNGNAEVDGASQLIEAFMRGGAQRPGDAVFTFIPTQAKRAQRRLLDLAGQIISITGAYADLAAEVYCGDADNPTAPSFYKCDAAGNRTTGGSYMKLPDCRGIFMRGAGQNGTYTAANGTPYDGGAIGTFIGDAIRNIGGKFRAIGSSGMTAPFYQLSGGPWYAADSGGSNVSIIDIEFSPAASGSPVSFETRPASISAYLCIKY